MTLQVDIPGPLLPATFEDRPNQFMIRARLVDGRQVEAHLPDPGRLHDLLRPEARLWLRPVADPRRRTQHTAVLVAASQGSLVSLDTQLPNRLVGAALRAGRLPEFAGWRLRSAEAATGRFRIDFELSDDQGRTLWLEIKSVTWAEDGWGLFPDAPTRRGAHHVRHLIELSERPATSAALLFVVQRDDVTQVRPAPAIDPDFAALLSRAENAGVQLHARRTRLTTEVIELLGPIPVAARAVDSQRR